MARLSIRARAPKASSGHIRAVMKANYGDELKPERQLRSKLHRAGLRFRKNSRPLSRFRCTADIVFSRNKLCVFVDGCFWHGCPQHFACPKSNSNWWRDKIRETHARDMRQRKQLRRNGWRVVAVWEHEVERNIDKVVSRILKLLRKL
jgi:DNA mismatch endonuclease (patch repair protein)